MGGWVGGGVTDLFLLPLEWVGGWVGGWTLTFFVFLVVVEEEEEERLFVGSGWVGGWTLTFLVFLVVEEEEEEEDAPLLRGVFEGVLRGRGRGAVERRRASSPA